MCTLTLLNSTKSKIDVRPLLGLLLSFNSEKNPDGWGFYGPGSKYFYKSKFQTFQDPNFFSGLSRLKKRDIILAHCRLSSNTYKNSVKDENSHPFDKKNIILAHNGTLFRKSGNKPENIIDSEDYANELNNLIDNSTLSMYECAKKVYDDHFKGKFAFIIYNKKDNNFYVARGSTATLFSAKIKYTLFNDDEEYIHIINTVDTNIKIAINTYNYTLQIAGIISKSPEVVIEEVPKNSFFVLNKEAFSLEKLGDFNEEEIKVTQSALGIFTRSLDDTYDYNYDYKPRVEMKLYNLGRLAYSIGLSMDDLICLIKIITDKNISITALTEKEIEFIYTFLEKMENSYKHLIKFWKRILLNTRDYSLDIYVGENIEFPFFLNSAERLKQIK